MIIVSMIDRFALNTNLRSILRSKVAI